jgi:N-acetyltransferase
MLKRGSNTLLRWRRIIRNTSSQVVLRQEDRVVGSTSYFAIVQQHKRLEIGYTWYEQNLWGTCVNPESKFLLLRHAFDDWHANRVQLSTDVNNIHSQKAILKLGATFERKTEKPRDKT